MRRAILPLLFGAASLCAAASCSAFGSDEVAVTDDGAAPNVEGGAASDAAEEGVAVVPSPDGGLVCGSLGVHDFCTQFSELPLEKGWDAVMPGPSMGLDVSGNAKSPPLAVLLDPPASGSRRMLPYLQKALAKQGQTFEAAFDVQLQAAPPTPSTVGITLFQVVATGASPITVSVIVTDSMPKIEVLADSDAGQRRRVFDTGIKISGYARIDVTVDLRGLAPMTVKIDGATVVAANLQDYGLYPPPSVGALVTRLGLLAEDDIFEWKILFDDVTLDVK